MKARVILDLSRLLSRADRATPTGIDRVEMAYARRLIATDLFAHDFAALDALRRIGPLAAGRAAAFVKATDHVWRGIPGRSEEPRQLARALMVGLHAAGDAGLHRPGRGRGRPVYLLVSHHHLEWPTSIRRLKARTNGQFVALVHDLIPIQLPEYARPAIAAVHRRRMETVAALADGVICNSDHTAAAFAPFLQAAGRSPPVVIAPLGVEAPAPADGASAPVEPPYFICVSTIEPRKNHVLLLNVWRRMAESLPAGTAPRLHIVGHRGWHNEAALDMIERSTAIAGLVVEHGQLSDAGLARLLAGARAALLPSFAEGYGLPVAEALSAGTPVLCSDLETLRGVGGDTPEYLDPLDGPAWMAAVLDYARPDSARRTAQLARMKSWRPPTWDDHFAAVELLLSRLGGDND